MMMRRTIILLLLLLVFAGLGYYFYTSRSDSSSSIDMRDREFAVENQSDIHKILIAQRNGKKLVFEKNQGDWIVDGQHIAHPNYMLNLLDVLTKLELKYIPPRNAYDKMMQSIGKSGVLVEIYNEAGDKIRAYQVGGTTAGELGTVFLMEGYYQPYVMEIPNFEGSLRGRFLIDDVDQIRDRTLFAYEMDDISEISIRYPKDEQQSFRVLREKNDFRILPYDENAFAKKTTPKAGAIKGFIRNFQDVDGEAYENKHSLKDSIKALLPIAEITIKDRQGNSKHVNLHSVLDVLNPDINTRRVGVDERVERYFADCSWGDFMIVQHLLFRKILWKYEDFY